MTSTFKDYEKAPCVLTFDEMQNIHEEILKDIAGDENAKKCYVQLLEHAHAYAAVRAGWPLFSTEEQRDADSGRTTCHDAVIIRLNSLARYLKKLGKEAIWRDELGYEEDDPYNRKRIGDFACYLAFVNGINAR